MSSPELNSFLFMRLEFRLCPLVFPLDIFQFDLKSVNLIFSPQDLVALWSSLFTMFLLFVIQRGTRP